MNLLSLWIFWNKIVPALEHETTSTDFYVSIQNIHAEIKFIIFIALSS